MNRIFFVACIAIGVFAGPVDAATSYAKGFLRVSHPWTRVTPPGADVAVGYLEIRNSGKDRDRLISASTPAAVGSHDVNVPASGPPGSATSV